MLTKQLQFAAFGCALLTAVQVHASLYDIAYTQTGESNQYGSATPPSITTATGQVDVVGGFALSGYLDVLTGPSTGHYILVPGTGNNGVFAYDNIVNVPPVNGGFLSSIGILFTSTGNPSGSEVNMWYNSSAQFSQPQGTYSLWGAPPNYNPESYGTASLTPVPEASTCIAGALMLLPFAASTVRCVRRNKAA